MEINAGAWYLRGVPSETGYHWDVCEPISGDVVAEVTLDPDTATMSCVGDDADAIQAAEQAIRRFAGQALGITVRD